MRIHQIGGIGFDSNIYLIVDEVVALIDAGTGQNFDIVRRNLNKVGIKPRDIGLLINTHCHFDHSGGDHDFVAAGCDVAIHEDEADLLRRGDRVITMAEIFEEELRAVDVARELHDGDRVKLGESEFRVIHTPGHTRGSISLYEPKLRVLFSGDTVFCDGVGRTDLPTSDAGALLRSLERLAELEVERLYPGHGPVDERNARKRLLEAIEFLEWPG